MKPRYRAFLIGNSAYPNDEDNLQLLRGPVNDVALLHAALKDPTVSMFPENAVGAHVDRTSYELLTALDDFFSEAQQDDVMLLYYSGHGRLDQNNTLYLCTRDTRTDRLRSTSIGSKRLNEMIESCPATRIVIILDCCHSGAFKGTDIAGPLTGTGRYVLASCRTKELANDASAVNSASLFTEHLVAGLRGGAFNAQGADYVTIEDLYAYVRDFLLKLGRQRPQFSSRGEGGLAIARRPQELIEAAPPAPSDTSPASPAPVVRSRANQLTAPRPRAAPTAGMLQLLPAPRLTHQLDLSLRPTAIWFTAGDARIVVAGVTPGGTSWTVKVFDTTTGAELSSNTYPGSMNGAALSPDGARLAAPCIRHTSSMGPPVYELQLVSLRTGTQDAVIEFPDIAMGVVAFSVDGAVVAAVVGYKRIFEVKIFNALTAELLTSHTYDSNVSEIAFSPDGSTMATASYDHSVRIFSTATGMESARHTHDGAVYALAYSGDGRFIATASEDATCRIVDVANGRELARFTCCGERPRRQFRRKERTPIPLIPLTSVAFSSDGAYVAAASKFINQQPARMYPEAQSGTAIFVILDATTGHELGRLAHTDRVRAQAFSPDARLVAAVGRTCQIVSVPDLQEFGTVSETAGRIIAATFSPNGTKFATADEYGRIGLFEIAVAVIV